MILNRDRVLQCGLFCDQCVNLYSQLFTKHIIHNKKEYVQVADVEGDGRISIYL
ncbi:hypothetical protein DPMN_116651 [Dreissena polymorpha]|uniref:Uncharacterized protein n=1 Tax=Dreissena polymorpha TaxID=45954 RepID=A0A9D4KNG8_DREPO|nr:hypothetical protein DPMN_116651 [Dreissena polymorpha]